jgi:uncharacterized protein
MNPNSPNLIIPVGTQVVTQVDIKNQNGDVLFVRGAVGVVVKQPLDATHAYRVRFMDGTEIALHRREYTVRKQFVDLQMDGDPLTDYNLYDHIIYRCIIGSRAYGLDNEASDTDLHWSLFGIPEQLENEARQECYWELQKFLMLALKANPNILECLYSPLVEYYQTYNGYVMAQFKLMNRHLEKQGTIKPKHAMHLIRLLISGITALREGYIPVRVEQYHDELLAIRNGQMDWAEVWRWRVSLHKEFDAAFAQTRLPERPDYEAANTFLLRARRSMI